MTVLQTIALPLGYSAIRMARGRLNKSDAHRCQHLDFYFSSIFFKPIPADLIDRELEILGGLIRL
jgi:hypothetical protein